LLKFEHEAWQLGFRRVAGVDEAGRGTLAGPVVAVALVFDADFLKAEARGLLKDIKDSKELTVAGRERGYEILCGLAEVDMAVGIADAFEIDRYNILQATFMAMNRAVCGLPQPPDHVLIDGPHTPRIPYSCTPIVDGDALSLTIAAASIVAKVTRDRLMVELDGRFPGYGLAGHKGYGTPFHIQALYEHGPSAVHRRSFRPVQDAIRIHAYLDSQKAVRNYGVTK
jgi:ribonuclease HII